MEGGTRVMIFGTTLSYWMDLLLFHSLCSFFTMGLLIFRRFVSPLDEVQNLVWAVISGWMSELSYLFLYGLLHISVGCLQFSYTFGSSLLLPWGKTFIVSVYGSLRWHSIFTIRTIQQHFFHQKDNICIFKNGSEMKGTPISRTSFVEVS